MRRDLVGVASVRGTVDAHRVAAAAAGPRDRDVDQPRRAEAQPPQRRRARVAQRRVRPAREHRGHPAARAGRGRRARPRRRRCGGDGAARAPPVARSSCRSGRAPRSCAARHDAVLAPASSAIRRSDGSCPPYRTSFVDPAPWPEDDGCRRTYGRGWRRNRARVSTRPAPTSRALRYNTRNVRSDVSRATIDAALVPRLEQVLDRVRGDAEALEDHRDPGRIDLDDLGRDLPDRLAQRQLVADRLRVPARPVRVHHRAVVDRARTGCRRQALARPAREHLTGRARPRARPPCPARPSRRAGRS